MHVGAGASYAKEMKKYLWKHDFELSLLHLASYTFWKCLKLIVQLWAACVSNNICIFKFMFRSSPCETSHLVKNKFQKMIWSFRIQMLQLPLSVWKYHEVNITTFKHMHVKTINSLLTRVLKLHNIFEDVQIAEFHHVSFFMVDMTPKMLVQPSACNVLWI